MNEHMLHIDTICSWNIYSEPWRRRDSYRMFEVFRPTQNLTFPQFNRLPIELRQCVWEMFCPALAARSRLYDLNYYPGEFIRDYDEYPKRRKPSKLMTSRNLAPQTRATRIVMAVHQESRQFALRILPDRLRFGRDGEFFVHFNKMKDVVYVEASDCKGVRVDGEYPCEVIEGVSDQIHNLAIDHYIFSFYKPPLAEILSGFPNVERIFVLMLYSDIKVPELKWCISGNVNHQNHEVYDNLTPGKDYLPHHYFWPDMTTPGGRDHALTQISLDTIAVRERGFLAWDWPPEYEDANLFTFAREFTPDVEFWPLIRFDQHRGEFAIERLEQYARFAENEGEHHDRSDWHWFRGQPGFVCNKDHSEDEYDSYDSDDWTVVEESESGDDEEWTEDDEYYSGDSEESESDGDEHAARDVPIADVDDFGEPGGRTQP